MSVNSEILLVMVTWPDGVPVEQLAQGVLEKRLAACVNAVPGVESWFRWKDQIDCEKEKVLLIKTTNARYMELEAHIRAVHPYDLPEIVAIPTQRGWEPWLQWVREETS
ncbi:MAG: divalent-cation tolerance protein CutA [Candidatus Eutrophobiaceae bacterium]